MDYGDMKAMQTTHVCAMCGSELVLIWDGENNLHRLCCAADHTHNGFQQRLSPQKALQRGQADEVVRPGAQKDLEEMAKRGVTALSLIPKTDIATGRILDDPAQVSLILWAESLGLTAHLGHVCLYHGKPYVTIDGYYYLLNEFRPELTIGTRPMSKEERKAYQIDLEDYAWIAERFREGLKLPGVGIGIVTKDEGEAKSSRDPGQFRAPVVHSHPQRMAEKRAEWQLLRKLIPLEVKE